MVFSELFFNTFWNTIKIRQWEIEGKVDYALLWKKNKEIELKRIFEDVSTINLKNWQAITWETQVARDY